MPKNSGKLLSFWFDSEERAVETVNFDSDFEELDVTDSSTVSPAMDFVMNRAKRTISITAFLRAANGAEINSGNLIAGNKYVVTAVDTVLAAYEIGEIFTADGTETMSATDKVRPLGAVLKGKDMALTVASVSVPVTSISFNEAWGEFDSTDTETTGDATEFIAGRRKSTSTIEVIMRSEDADLLDESPAAQTVVVTFGSGYTLTGSATFKKKSIAAIAKGDMTKVSYDVTWSGEITSTLNVLARGESKAVEVIYEAGTTNKEQTGNVILLNMTVSGDVNSVISVSYTGNWVGAVAEDVLT